MTPPPLRALRRFRTDRGGTAAVEFAILIPMLMVMVIGVIQYGGLILGHQQMHNGIASGAVYVMRGGSDTTAIHDIALGAWPNKPSDASISVVQSCTCAGAASGCSALCSDQSYPLAFTTITGSGTYTGLFASQSMTATQVIRTR
ncbi:MAG TPA: TadE/TadG family type IV pilus assembly protein [Caulobacteraceae bacterium]|jgi:Flp pilus assembly pilin Flp